VANPQKNCNLKKWKKNSNIIFSFFSPENFISPKFQENEKFTTFFHSQVLFLGKLFYLFIYFSVWIVFYECDAKQANNANSSWEDATSQTGGCPQEDLVKLGATYILDM